MNKKPLVLIVDDEKANRNILSDRIISYGMEPVEAENGLSALAFVEKKHPDLILLDIMMPFMNGLDVLSNLKNDTNTNTIPVLVISALDEIETIVQAINGGAEDFLPKPFEPAILKARVVSCIQKKRAVNSADDYRKKLQEYNLNLENRVKEQVQKITDGYEGTTFAMCKMAEYRDPETGEHLSRMREYCKVLATSLMNDFHYDDVIDTAYISTIYTASPLHDIGKVGIPDNILLKPGKLSPEEFEIMKTHASIGRDALLQVNKLYPGNEIVKLGIEIAGGHHEKWDGTGYPNGLKGDEIPLSARILTLGDVYDALTSKRVYKEAFSHEKSKSIILQGSGNHFDPDIVDAFNKSEDKFIEISRRYR